LTVFLQGATGPVMSGGYSAATPIAVTASHAAT
jgi:hypothetical protein